MKCIYIVLLILFSVSTICADSPIGVTLRMRGDITLSRDEETSDLAEGESLVNRDVLTTYDEAFAFIKFVDDGATLRLFENSVLTLNTEQDEDKLNKNSFLEVGNVLTSVRRDSGDMNIETPTTVASVRGTEGFIVVSDDGTTLIIVLSGSFYVLNKESGESTTVTGGNTCHSDGTGALDIYTTTDIDPEWLESIEGDSIDESEVYRIELMHEDGQQRIIEIEVE